MEIFWKIYKCTLFHFSKLAGSVHTFFLSKDVFGSNVFCTLTSFIKSAIDKRFILWVVTYMKGSMTKANSFYVHNIKHRTKNWRNNRYFLSGLWVKRVKKSTIQLFKSKSQCQYRTNFLTIKAKLCVP